MKKHLLTVAAVLVTSSSLVLLLGQLESPCHASALMAQEPAPGRSTTPVRPKFEVASVKPCKETDSGGRGGAGGSSPGRLYLSCRPVMSLIKTAYTIYAEDSPGLHVILRASVEGGPAWINSDLYFLEAKADGPANQATMRGPMLRALLEERFQLKVRRETREAPLYALTVTKNGPKLHPTLEGSCARDQGGLPDMAGRSECRSYQVRPGREPSNRIGDSYGMSLDEFAKTLIMYGLDRPVVNKTGIAGTFDFHLEYAPDQTSPGAHVDSDNAADVVGLPVATALQQQLGLKLVPAKGPVEFLVIDHVEKPSGN
jgi:uncharacterized protein (TIGR03435 family)